MEELLASFAGGEKPAPRSPASAREFSPSGLPQKTEQQESSEQKIRGSSKVSDLPHAAKHELISESKTRNHHRSKG